MQKTEDPKSTRRGRPTKYDTLLECMDGDTYVAARGVDYEVESYIFRNIIHRYATRANMRVTTTLLDANHVQFRFYTDETEE